MNTDCRSANEVAALEQIISKGLFYSFFQLQEAQDQHREAVQRAEKTQDHLQKYSLNSITPVFIKQINKRCSVASVSVLIAVSLKPGQSLTSEFLQMHTFE